MNRLFLLLVLAGCGEIPVQEDETSEPVATVASPVPVAASEPPPPPGQLPLGYYQRQCQWDACDGPPPSLPTPALDPQPDALAD